MASPHHSPALPALSTFVGSQPFTAATLSPQVTSPIVAHAGLMFSPPFGPLAPAWLDSPHLLPLSPSFTPAEFEHPAPSSPGPSLQPTTAHNGGSDGDANSSPHSSKRIREMSEDKLQHKRHKQRQSDWSRRQKEHLALTRLHALLTGEEGVAEDSEDGGGGDDSKQAARMNKADILQESAARIEQLLLLVAQLTEACQTKSRSGCDGFNNQSVVGITAACAHLDLLPRAMSSPIRAHLERIGLHSSMFVHSSVTQLLLDARSGLVADVSERWLATSGWTRSEVIARRFFPPARLMITQPDLLRTRNRIMASKRVLVLGKNGRMVPQKQEPQYEKSLRLAQQLWRGEIDTMDAVWRGQMRDGKMYDRRIYSWVSEWEDVECGGGVRMKQPCYIMAVCSVADIVCVDH